MLVTAYDKEAYDKATYLLEKGLIPDHEFLEVVQKLTEQKKGAPKGSLNNTKDVNVSS